MSDAAPRLLHRPGLAAGALGLWFLLFHGRAADAGILSDSWSMLLAASRPLGQALAHTYRYHTIPVTNAFTALQWRLFGLSEAPYQWLNLLGIFLVAWLFVRLAERLSGDRRLAVLAGAVLLASASFYQVTYWPVVGTFHSLGAVFYLLALGATLDGRPWRLALFAVLGFVTYEPMISIVPVALGLRLLAPSRRELGPRLLTLGPWLGAALLVAAAVAAIKLPALARGDQLVSPAESSPQIQQRVELAARAVVSAFTLRGSTTVLDTWMGFAAVPNRLGVALAWLGAGLVFGAWAAWRGTRTTRVALLWFTGHLGVLALGTPIVSRHLYLLALPAALLSATLLVRTLERLVARGLAPRLGFALGAFVLAGLAFGASRDLVIADRAHEDATAVARDLSQRLVTWTAQGRTVHVADLPARIGPPGLQAFAFLNGTHARLELAAPTTYRREQLQFWYTREPPPGRRAYANGSRPMSLEELERRAAEPDQAVLRYEPASGRLVELGAPRAPGL